VCGCAGVRVCGCAGVRVCGCAGAASGAGEVVRPGAAFGVGVGIGIDVGVGICVNAGVAADVSAGVSGGVSGGVSARVDAGMSAGVRASVRAARLGTALVLTQPLNDAGPQRCALLLTEIAHVTDGFEAELARHEVDVLNFRAGKVFEKRVA
jgi:hypothetical protein